jgi:hypothetical protein
LERKERPAVKRATAEFNSDIGELRKAVADAIGPHLSVESTMLLSDLLENRLDAIEKFYELLLSEKDGKVLIDENDFDVVTQKYLCVLRYFTRFPGEPSGSTYKMTVISDFYYLLSYHTREWGWTEN